MEILGKRISDGRVTYVFNTIEPERIIYLYFRTQRFIILLSAPFDSQTFR